MGLSFSFQLAPGIRIRATNRGLRASIGPRSARLHVGAGRPGFSTGAGPFTYYTPLDGGGQRKQSNASYQRALSATPAAAAKAEEAHRLAALILELANVHREEFRPAQRPIAPARPPVDREAIHQRHRERALDGISVFRRSKRAAAREQAASRAGAEIQQQESAAHQERYQLQAAMDAEWAALAANDPPAVIWALAQAFEDNEAAAAPLGVDGADAALVVLAPQESVIPERMPGTTAAGNVSLRKMSKGDRQSLYSEIVLGHVLVTIKEALAVAAGLQGVRVVALRRAEDDAYGRARFDCVLAGSWARSAFEGVRWIASASTIARDTATELEMNPGFQPLDLAGRPDLQELLKAVDVEELAT